MTLSISTSNALIDQTPTITDAGTNEVASNISDPDHSLNYTCGTGATNFSVDYGAQSNISYVAISGHTAATLANATIELYDDTLLIDSVSLKRNNNVMFTFPEMSFQNLIVRFVTVPNNYQMTVSFIAAGKHLSIERGTQAGYARQWLNRHTVQRTTSTLDYMPISTTSKAKALQGKLTLPNELTVFSEGEWQDFVDFSYEQPFFVKEFEDKPESSYICYDPKHGTKSHAQTLELNAVTLGFTLFNGLT